MVWISDLFAGNSASWSGGVAHSILALALVIVVGIMFGKIKVAGISLGVTWILFAGIAFGHFGLRLDGHLLHFVQELGLILFVFSIGLQVGPGFFSSFRKGGMQLNLLATSVVVLGIIITYIIHKITNIPIATMVGIMSGAVTNTPGLGAAQQTASELTGIKDPSIATGYAVTYPLAVVGIIASIIALRYIFKISNAKEEQAISSAQEKNEVDVHQLSLRIENTLLDGRKVGDVHDLISRNFVISRVRHKDGTVEIAHPDMILHCDEDILIVASSAALPALSAFIGKETNMEWKQMNTTLISRRILITKPEVTGKSLAQLRVGSFGVSITRINRSGVDLVANYALQLQLGDKITVVGTQTAVMEVEKVLGNSLKRLDAPNLFPIFLGIFLGVIFGSIPFAIPGIPQPIKLGLAGGPLIISILISRFGPKYKMVTYTTMSANLMVREIGIALFLACVGLGAGESFIDTVVHGGYKWIGYGILITMLPLLAVGMVGRLCFKLNYFTLSGLLAGSVTDPPALAYANDTAGNDIPAVGYATVYPLVMFLRVLGAQLLILFLA